MTTDTSQNIVLKPPKTIDEQIALLQSRGLIIENILEAKICLKENNYYRVNYYFHKFIDSSDKFIPGTKFSQILDIYKTDCMLRKNIFSILEPIEIRLKSSIAYYLGTTYGSDAFYKKELYNWESTYIELLDFLKDTTKESDNPVIKHHLDHYSGYFPIWVIVEFLSFGKSSKLYRNLATRDRKNISVGYYNLPEHLFHNWIYSLAVIRNICAHYGYLYNRSFSVPINFGYDSVKLSGYENTLFGIFYSIKKLSKPNCWNNFYLEIINDIGKDKLISKYNFPPDFEYLDR